MDDLDISLKEMYKAIERHKNKSTMEMGYTPYNEEASMYALASIAESLARIAKRGEPVINDDDHADDEIW